MLLRIEPRQFTPEVVVLGLTGKLAALSDSQRLEAMVKELLLQNRLRLIFDLSGVDYIDSRGIGAIVYCFAAAIRAGGGLRMAGATERIRHLMKTTRLEDVLDFYPTVAAAAEVFTLAPREGHQSPA